MSLKTKKRENIMVYGLRQVNKTADHNEKRVGYFENQS